MARYLIKKILGWVVMIFLAVNITYLLANFFLDPKALFIGRRPPVPADQIAATLKPLNLDQSVPLLERWWTWLTNILLHWDWGCSPIGVAVTEEIGYRIWVSAQLLLGATVIAIVLGVGLGVFAASRQYSMKDRISQGFSILALNTHIVVASLAVVWLAITINRSVGARIFYVTGSGDPALGGIEGLIDMLQHLILPTISLVIISYASYYFMQRSLLLDNIGAQYVLTARAKGLTRSKAIRKHALRTSLIPVATSVAFSLPGIFTGAILTESIFVWHGMGEYFITTLAKNDIHGVVAVAAFGALMTAIGAILSDLIVVFLDPRVRVN